MYAKSDAEGQIFQNTIESTITHNPLTWVFLGAAAASSALKNRNKGQAMLKTGAAERSSKRNSMKPVIAQVALAGGVLFAGGEAVGLGVDGMAHLHHAGAAQHQAYRAASPHQAFKLKERAAAEHIEATKDAGLGLAAGAAEVSMLVKGIKINRAQRRR